MLPERSRGVSGQEWGLDCASRKEPRVPGHAEPVTETETVAVPESVTVAVTEPVSASVARGSEVTVPAADQTRTPDDWHPRLHCRCPLPAVSDL